MAFTATLACRCRPAALSAAKTQPPAIPAMPPPRWPIASAIPPPANQAPTQAASCARLSRDRHIRYLEPRGAEEATARGRGRDS
jgi:hypothetical protein